MRNLSCFVLYLACVSSLVAAQRGRGKSFLLLIFYTFECGRPVGNPTGRKTEKKIGPSVGEWGGFERSKAGEGEGRTILESFSLSLLNLRNMLLRNVD